MSRSKQKSHLNLKFHANWTFSALQKATRRCPWTTSEKQTSTRRRMKQVDTGHPVGCGHLRGEHSEAGFTPLWSLTALPPGPAELKRAVSTKTQTPLFPCFSASLSAGCHQEATLPQPKRECGPRRPKDAAQPGLLGHPLTSLWQAGSHPRS